MIVTLEELKAHLNILDGGDDGLLIAKIKAAESYLNRQLGFVIATEFAADVPADLKEAALQLAAHWYENREASIVGVSVQMMPFNLEEIIRSYRTWSF